MALSPILFNILISNMRGGNITNMLFADDIDVLSEEEQELEALVESLDKTCAMSVLRRPD